MSLSSVWRKLEDDKRDSTNVDDSLQRSPNVVFILSYSIFFVVSQLHYFIRFPTSLLIPSPPFITCHLSLVTSLSITTSTFHSNKHTIEFDISDSPWSRFPSGAAPNRSQCPNRADFPSRDCNSACPWPHLHRSTTSSPWNRTPSASNASLCWTETYWTARRQGKWCRNTPRKRACTRSTSRSARTETWNPSPPSSPCWYPNPTRRNDSKIATKMQYESVMGCVSGTISTRGSKRAICLIVFILKPYTSSQTTMRSEQHAYNRSFHDGRTRLRCPEASISRGPGKSNRPPSIQTPVPCRIYKPLVSSENDRVQHALVE